MRELNEEQRIAVSHFAGPMLVLGDLVPERHIQLQSVSNGWLMSMM